MAELSVSDQIMNDWQDLTTEEQHARMLTALSDVARQHRTSEMDDDQREHADYEGAYNHIVMLSRVALGLAVRDEMP